MIKMHLKFISPTVAGTTACGSGVFDTSARLDVQAAQMRNRTWLSGNVGQEGLSDHAEVPYIDPIVWDKS